MNSDIEALTKTRESQLPLSSPAKGPANEGENNNSCPFNNPSLTTNQSQGTYTNEPNTSRQKSILTRIIQSCPTPLEPKSMLVIGITALIGLLSVPYKINGNGNLVPTPLFHQPTNTFALFLIVFIIFFYFAAIGLALEEAKPEIAKPEIAKVFNIISFVFLLLEATILLWALIPKNISWIPWILFACTAVVVFGVLVLGLFTDLATDDNSQRSSSTSTATACGSLRSQPLICPIASPPLGSDPLFSSQFSASGSDSPMSFPTVSDEEKAIALTIRAEGSLGREEWRIPVSSKQQNPERETESLSSAPASARPVWTKRGILFHLFGVLVLRRFTDKSSALKSTASRLPV